MRALETGLLTFLLLAQASFGHAQGYNVPVTPPQSDEQSDEQPSKQPSKQRYVCPGAGYYDNLQTCCCVNQSTGQYCLRESEGQSCNLACDHSFPC
jgi:hypothetical protein